MNQDKDELLNDKIFFIPESLEEQAKKEYPSGYFMGMKIVVNRHSKQGQWYIEKSNQTG